MEEWYENIYQQTGIFVTTPGVPLGITVGKFNTIHTFLMVPSGDVIRRPILWCKILRPPEDLNIDLPMNVRVIVFRGRLKGMFGKVVGSYNGRVFIQTLDGSMPRYHPAINKFEWKYFVEDAECLYIWRMHQTPEQVYPEGFYEKLTSRGC